MLLSLFFAASPPFDQANGIASNTFVLLVNPVLTPGQTCLDG